MSSEYVLGINSGVAKRVMTSSRKVEPSGRAALMSTKPAWTRRSAVDSLSCAVNFCVSQSGRGVSDSSVVIRTFGIDTRRLCSYVVSILRGITHTAKKFLETL